MKHYLLRYFLVAFAAILLVAGSTRVFAQAGAPPRLADVFQVRSNDSAAVTSEPAETDEPTETLEPVETDEPTETAEPTEVDNQDNDDDQGEDQNNDDDQDEDQNEGCDEGDGTNGTVEQISDASWVISGQVYLVTPDTEIEDTIVVNDAVEVEFVTNSDGSLTATEIKLGTGESLCGGDDNQGDDNQGDDNDQGEDYSGSDDSGSGSDDGSSGSDDSSSDSDEDDGDHSGTGGGDD
jgi:hypothetical protein